LPGRRRINRRSARVFKNIEIVRVKRSGKSSIRLGAIAVGSRIKNNLIDPATFAISDIIRFNFNSGVGVQ
jgi:hypothetical protein